MDENQLALFKGIDLEVYDKGKDELTLAEFPLALAGKSPKKAGLTSVKYKDIIRDKSTGQPVTRTITIQGSDEFGLPTYYDEEVLFGILQLTNLQRHGDDWPTEIRFSRYHLAKILGLNTDGRTYRRLWDSLHRLANTTYNFNFAFFDKMDEEWRPSVVITFIQTLIVHGGPVPGKNGEVTVRWNEDIHRNFQAGYLRDINFLEYREMGHPLAKALYRYLGKHFWRRPKLKFNLKTLAFEKLGLSRSYNVGQIKRELKPAIQKLEDQGIIRRVTPSQRYEKVQVGVWNVHFEKATNQKDLEIQVDPRNELETKLNGHGVSPGVAAELVGRFPSEVIERKIDEFEFLLGKKKGPKTNPGAWLAKSIKEDWNPDPEYKTPEEVALEEKQRQEIKEQRKRKRLEEEEKARQLEEEKQQRELAEADKVQAYMEQFTEEEQVEMVKEAERIALKNGSQWILMKGPIGDLERETALRDYVFAHMKRKRGGD